MLDFSSAMHPHYTKNRIMMCQPNSN